MEVLFSGGKVITAEINGHLIRTDQRLKSGYENSTLTPLELFSASIGLCIGVHIRTFCDEHKISTDNIKIFQNSEIEKQTGLPSLFKIDIELPFGFPEEYVNDIKKAAMIGDVIKAIEFHPTLKINTSKHTK